MCCYTEEEKEIKTEVSYKEGLVGHNQDDNTQTFLQFKTVLHLFPESVHAWKTSLKTVYH